MKLAFPEIKDFRELFSAIVPHDKTRTIAEWAVDACWGSEEQEKIRIRSYCDVRRTGALDVEPNEVLLGHLRQELCVPGDVSFYVVDRRDGTSLVTARYSQIIGSFWLAVVATETIPEGDS